MAISFVDEAVEMTQEEMENMGRGGKLKDGQVFSLFGQRTPDEAMAEYRAAMEDRPAQNSDEAAFDRWMLIPSRAG